MKKTLTLAVSLALAAASGQALAYEPGQWLVRAGAATVDPNASSDDINLPTGLVAEADVDDDTQLSIIPVYMVDEKWGIELLLATPFEHTVDAKGKGAIAGTTVTAGDIKHLPPTLSIQWYPRGGEDGWQPYIGIGMNYTTFFDEEADSQLIGLLGDLTVDPNGVAVDDANLDLDDSFGLAAQVGVDIPFAENWAFNAGVWYIDIETDATVTAKSQGVTVDKVQFDVDIDPWVYNIGIAYKF